VVRDPEVVPVHDHLAAHAVAFDHLAGEVDAGDEW
jgi:hypothetical protein